MNAALATGTCALLLPVVVIAAAIGGVQFAQPSSTALADIPPRYLALYQEAAGELGLAWELLAAIGKVESDHGRNPASWRPNAAGAEGPMQFLPTTFAAYSSTSGSTAPDVYDPRDAIYAAASLLLDNNVRNKPRQALYAYNHAGWYVELVLSWAATYTSTSEGRADSAAAPGGLDDGRASAQRVLASPRIRLLPDAAADIRAGRVDPRLLALLLALADSHQLGHVGPFVSGHSYYVAGTNRPSNHAPGRAVDIGTINGSPVSANNDAARSAALSLSTLPVSIRPTEVGTPWPDLLGSVYFSDPDHQNHIHIGFDS